MPQPLDKIARDLRAAVLGSDHQQASSLANRYAQAVAQQWTLMPPAERAASGLPKQATELLTWAREMAIMQRAMAEQQAAAIEMATRYLTARSNYVQSAAL
jgi:hypothetical protein